MDTTTPSYEVDLEDERLESVNDKWSGISDEVTNNYQNMIDGVDEQYKGLQDAMDKSVEAQKQNQQALTDFTIEKIEQQKEQAHKDYVKEQSGAYKDWQKQSDRYGVNAEQMAASGMTNTGFGESSRVAMYNTYQNRVATAREALSQAMLNYDNNIKEAMLQNNSILAEIEADAAIKAAELALEGFQYKNSLILEQTNKKLELETMRSQEWYKMLEQINAENALAEDVRQFNETQKFQGERDIDKDEDETEPTIYNEDGDEEDIDKDEDEEYPVNTEYYRGNKNPDAEKYGTFNNGGKIGYQPKGISGHGKLKDSGDTITFTTTTLSGENRTVTQKVWKAEDGTKWYWDGRYNKYIEFKENKENSDSSTNESFGDARANPLISSIPPRSEIQAVGKFSDGPAVSTEYYYGDLNPDATKYGTFKNGYQPKGISGHGKLTKQGTIIDVQTTTLYGEEKTVTQNIWIADDGTCWYWDGRKNKYIYIPMDS